MTTVTVRYVQSNDREAWASLFSDYRTFYKKSPNPAVVETVWGWVINPEPSTQSLIAEVEDQPVGIANFPIYNRSLNADKVLYLDDLLLPQ